MQRVDSLEETLMLGGIEGRRKGDNRGWDGWMASPTRWIWVWVNSGSWWWTGRPGVLQFMGSQSQIWPSDWTELSDWMIKLPTAFFTELEQKISQFVWKRKRPWIPKRVWERRMELEESTFLTSDYTTKLQLSRQYGTGTKTEIETNGTR